MVVTVTHRRLHQAHPARDLPRPAPRRQGPRRHGDQGRGCGHQAVRHLDPHAGAVLLDRTARSTASRSGGCPKARRRRAAGRWSTCCRWPRARRSRPCCRCPRTRRNGASSTSCSRPPRAASGATRWTPSPTCRPNGKFAMRFDERIATDRLIGVALLTEEDDVLLATRNGKAIRFAATDVREFQSRTSTGVRGISLHERRRGHLAVDPPGLRRDHRGARGLSARRAVEGEASASRRFRAERMAEFAEAEEFILTVCANGYGKRSSAYEYRRTNRGGQGITNIDNLERNGPVVASFPAHQRRAADAGHRPGQADPHDASATPASSAATAPASACSTSPRTSMSSRAARIEERGGGRDEAEEMVAEDLGAAPPAAAIGQGPARRRHRPGNASGQPGRGRRRASGVEVDDLRSPASPPRAAACGGIAPDRARSRAGPTASPRRARSSAPLRRRPPGVSSWAA